MRCASSFLSEKHALYLNRTWIDGWVSRAAMTTSLGQHVHGKIKGSGDISLDICIVFDSVNKTILAL